MRDALTHSTMQFARALIMPNLKPPIRTPEDAQAYRQRICDARRPDTKFEPYLSLYLTPETDPFDVHRAKKDPYILGYKLYPAGATTHSASGVSDLRAVYPVFEAMQEVGLVLQIHGESIDPGCDIFDREAVFVESSLRALTRDFPRLRIVLEHITTREAADFVRAASDNVAATITPQHLLYNRNEIFRGGIRPHYYCLPILKREEHRRALIEAIRSGNRRFFLGTDSAPHPKVHKESDCGCAGIFSAHAAMELYAEAFDAAGALPHLAAFAALSGADFYGLPHNAGEMLIRSIPRRIPASYAFGDEQVVPLRADDAIAWTATRVS